MQPLCAVEHCDRPVQDATVCGACASQLETALGDVPALAEEIELVATRQSRMGSGNNGRRSTVDPVVFDIDATIMRNALRNTLTTWLRELIHTGEQSPTDEIPAAARWILVRVERIRHHPAGGEAVDEITACVRDVERQVMPASDRWYAGPCDCGKDLYVPPTAVMRTCPACGREYDVADRRDWLLDKAEDYLAHATLISQALTALAEPVTPERIWKWKERGRITAHSVDRFGRNLYRLGEVRQLLRGSQRVAA